MDVRGGSHVIPALLGASFEPPSTTDFVYGCWGSGFTFLGFTFCFNFILLLLDPDDA